ncbi:MAG TPA: immunoglobulin domain-containing protein, partial [Verrucomicrobiae bacterium]|nr:immunoglobulin domain-containing protein [Verrucomicrobiae bacterium]
RGFAWAQIDLPGTNDLYVVSVHLLTSSATARGTEAANLKTLIQSNFPSNAWIVVAGDFNTDSRTETPTMTTFSGYLSDRPIPVDNNGNSDTSLNRNHPHDYVLPGFSFTNIETASTFPSHIFPGGLVFDSRVYTPLSDVAPVLYGDSSNAQHMAVLKDFLVPFSGTNSGNLPFLTVQPHDLTVVRGDDATFSVTANSSSAVTYQWQFNSTNLLGATTNFFTVTDAQPADAGNYSVVVSNSVGGVSSSNAALTVVTSPLITTNPASQTVNKGDDATFTVFAVGIQPLAYQWRFNGTNIFGAIANFYTVTNAQPADEGGYSVIVTNNSGSTTSIVASLTVSEVVTGAPVTLVAWDVSGQTGFGLSPLP